MVGIPLSVPLYLLFLLFVTAGFTGVDTQMTETLRAILYLLSGFGLLLILFLMREVKYYYQVQKLQLVSNSLFMFMHLSVCIWFMLSIEISTVLGVMGGCLISLSFITHNLLEEPKKWNLAREQGKFKKILNEDDWTFKFEIPNTIETIFLSMQEKEGRKNLLKRLEKLHYLMPAIGMALSRNFPDQRTALMTILLLFFVLLFASQVKIPLYREIRQWEEEKGRPLLLHESWNR